jgi:hypothetical protein
MGVLGAQTHNQKDMPSTVIVQHKMYSINLVYAKADEGLLEKLPKSKIDKRKSLLGRSCWGLAGDRTRDLSQAML